jgi:hypothetical protein
MRLVVLVLGDALLRLSFVAYQIVVRPDRSADLIFPSRVTSGSPRWPR